MVPVRPADYLGWWLALAVGCQLVFWGCVAYTVLVVWGHPHLNFTTADDVDATSLALQFLLALAGLGSFFLSLQRRRWWRGVIWLGLAIGLAAVTLAGAMLLALVTGVAGTTPG